MKTKINITGQISGNSTLANAINTIESTISKGMFNSYKIEFPTKGKAKKALWSAYNYLRKEEPEFAKCGIRYNPGYSLSYDASCAKIQDK